NKYVIGMQSRWYRAHQWFVAKHSSQTKVKCAIKVHRSAVTPHCVPENYNFPGRPEHLKGHYPRNYATNDFLRRGFQKAIDDGLFTEANCCQRYHFVVTVPKSEVDIPLDAHFQPKRNNYIYHYLIER